MHSSSFILPDRLNWHICHWPLGGRQLNTMVEYVNKKAGTFRKPGLWSCAALRYHSTACVTITTCLFRVTRAVTHAGGDLMEEAGRISSLDHLVDVSSGGKGKVTVVMCHG